MRLDRPARGFIRLARILRRFPFRDINQLRKFRMGQIDAHLAHKEKEIMTV